MSADHSIRPLTPAEIEAQAVESDLANLRDKQAGGHHVRNDARAFQLQQQYAGLCLPEGQS